MRDFDSLVPVLHDEFKECMSLFMELYDAISKRLAARAVEHLDLPIDADEVAYLIDGALLDNHWFFAALNEKSKKAGMSHNEYLVRYFVRRIKEYSEYIDDDV